jgi:hypothetical protein
MIPIFAASASLSCAQTETLEHCALLLEWIVIAVAAAEPIAEVVVVLVVHIGFFGVNTASGVGCLVQAEGTWACRGDTLGTTVACEVTLLENLDEVVFAVALNRACVADAGRCPIITIFSGRWVASQTCEDSLSQRSEDFGACIDALEES